MSSAELRLLALPGFPEVQSGDDIAALTAQALARGGLTLGADDVLVFAQKVISKAEGRRIDLAGVVPGARALELAQDRGEGSPAGRTGAARIGESSASPKMS